MKLVLRPAAIADIREARDYYEEAQSGLGARFGEALDRLFERLETFPRSAPEVEGYEAIRRASVPAFPYGAFYLLEGDLIDTLRVVHARRRWPADVRVRES